MFIKDYYKALIIYVKKKIKLIVNNDFEIAKNSNLMAFTLEKR